MAKKSGGDSLPIRKVRVDSIQTGQVDAMVYLAGNTRCSVRVSKTRAVKVGDKEILAWQVRPNPEQGPVYISVAHRQQVVLAVLKAAAATFHASRKELPNAYLSQKDGE